MSIYRLIDSKPFAYLPDQKRVANRLLQIWAQEIQNYETTFHYKGRRSKHTLEEDDSDFEANNLDLLDMVVD
jgi:hypothetical protein